MHERSSGAIGGTAYLRTINTDASEMHSSFDNKGGAVKKKKKKEVNS